MLFEGGFSPKEESIYDEVSTSANTNHELPLQHNDYTQKPLDSKLSFSFFYFQLLFFSLPRHFSLLLSSPLAATTAYSIISISLTGWMKKKTCAWDENES